MNTMKPTTFQQQHVLEFVQRFFSANGFPPTLREIADAVSLSHVNAVRGHLAALEKKGYISRIPDKARSIRVIAMPSAFSAFKRKLHEVLRTDEGVVHQVIYGLGWITWRGKVELSGEVRERLAECLDREAVEHGWKLLEQRIEPDSVRLVVRVWPNHSADLVMRRFKMAGEAGVRRLWKKSNGERVWARGYAATTEIELLDELIQKLREKPVPHRASPREPGPMTNRR
jgi:DNA-binding MarR family transcriptional regulator